MAAIKNSDKSKEQLLNEIAQLKKRNAELSALHSCIANKHKQLESSFQQIQAVYEAIPGFISIVDRNYNIIDVNQNKIGTINKCQHQQKSDVLGKKCYQVFKQRNSPCPQCDICKVLSTGKCTVRRSTADEEALTGKAFEIQLQPVIDEAGTITAILELEVDITDRIKLEKESAYQLKLFQKLLDSIPTPVFYKDINGYYLGANDAFEQFTGITKEDLVGKSVYDIFPRELADKYFKMDNDLLMNPGIQRYEFKSKDAFGQIRDVIFNKATFLKDDETLGGLVGVILDITERKQAEERLTYISTHDALTGLYNRAYFQKEMDHKRQHSDTPLALIMCDVDGLKLINDTLGHPAGDNILIKTAAVLKKCVKENSIIARIGGDEFAIILNNTSRTQVADICGKIHSEIECINRQNPDTFLSISLGYAISHKPVDLHKLFRNADDNMYREKLLKTRSRHSGIVSTIMQLLRERDLITQVHSDRVQVLTAILGKRAGLPEAKIADLRLLSRFHDIGKVAIPDKILFKADKLTQPEMAQMQKHAEIGYRIAQSSAELLHIADWILKHHEWWNGNGYPLGLAGEEIPLECRILAIVDAYDAMTSDRPYRNALPQDIAITELQRCAGIQFDPELIDLFITVLQEGTTN